jgi:large subunit ribosomal protein L4
MATKKVNLAVVNQAGEDAGKVSVEASVFGVEVNNQVMFDAVQVYQANMRQATAKTKTRSEVSGGGKKPWRQKGTGRARAGSSRSPIWVGGGKVFGPIGNQNFKLSQNKKAHALALKSALTSKVNDKALVVVDEFKLDSVKTKAFVEVLAKLNVSGKALLVLDDANAVVVASARNIPTLTVTTTNNLSVYDLLNNGTVVFTKEALKTVEGDLK